MDAGAVPRAGLHRPHRPRWQRNRTPDRESRRPLHRAHRASRHGASAAHSRRNLRRTGWTSAWTRRVRQRRRPGVRSWPSPALRERIPELAEIFHPIVFVANVGEEGEGNLNGMRYLCRQSSTGGKIQAFVVLDGPNSDHITSQALASRRFDVTISGPGGHSWSDYGIANPVHALARAIAFFTEHRLPANGGSRSSSNFGILEGGSSINSIPTDARTKVDIRSESAVEAGRNRKRCSPRR